MSWLRIRRRAWHTERHLRHQGPRRGDVPLSFHLLVDQRVVVLQVSAHPFVRERGPDDELVDRGRVLGPDGEVILGEGELVLQLARVLRVLEVEDGAVGFAEAVEAWFGVLVELLRRGDGLDDLGDEVPELQVLVFEEEDEASRVGPEGGGGLFEGGLEEFFDARVWEGGFGGESVVCSAGGHGLEEGGGVFGLRRHCSLGGWGVGFEGFGLGNWTRVEN